MRPSPCLFPAVVQVAHLEKLMGRTLGDAKDPLLLSVRSGARVSMPGAGEATPE